MFECCCCVPSVGGQVFSFSFFWAQKTGHNHICDHGSGGGWLLERRRDKEKSVQTFFCVVRSVRTTALGFAKLLLQMQRGNTKRVDISHPVIRSPPSCKKRLRKKIVYFSASLFSATGYGHVPLSENGRGLLFGQAGKQYLTRSKPDDKHIPLVLLDNVQVRKKTCFKTRRAVHKSFFCSENYFFRIAAAIVIVAACAVSYVNAVSSV